MEILNVIKLALTIPFPYVSGNHIWKRSGRAVYLVPKAREYYNAVAYTVASNSCDVGLSCALKVTMLVFPPDKRKRDLTNLLKVIEDALTKARVWQDDSLVHHLDVKKMDVDKTCPRIEILIENIDAA